MNIKERFYANLDLIREDWEKDAADWSKKRADNSRFAKSQAKADHLLARIDPNYRKEKEKEAKHYKKLSKKYAKKAVTGMDEEAEQLDEIVGSMLAGAALGLGAGGVISNAMSGNPIGKKIKKIISKKLAKKYAKKAVTGMDEEAEQLDELNPKTLGNYIKKAHKNTNKLTLTLDNPKAPKEYAKQAERKFRNRNKGIERAADKLSR